MDRPTLVKIPAKPEYVSTARMVVAAFAGLLGFDSDAVEDIKIAVSEACTSAILQIHKEARAEERTVTVSAHEKENYLVVDIIFYVKDTAGVDQVSKQLHERDLGMSILNTIMDRVEIMKARQDGVTIRLAKTIPSGHPR